MKVRVLKNFKDKKTGKRRKAGETFICSKERYEEILSVDVLVEEVPAEKKTAEKGTAEK